MMSRGTSPLTEPNRDQRPSRLSADQGPICPSCNSTQLDSFYRMCNAPAHSCLLMDSQEEALAYPRGTLDLAFCNDCGFITNTCYDESLRDYSPRYEETQHFSGCFNEFARRLAQRWVDDYDLRQKQILEIGCGKGEFLELLCTLGDNQGVGFDPGVHPDRLDNEARSRIRFVKDYYSEQYSHESSDAICCRHTLEHIPDTDRFLAAIRRNIEGREGQLVLFELPDTTRVLREYAFWDLYYEHCSYFTAGSLARLFRRNRFNLLELRRDFDDQYLLIVAEPVDSMPPARLKLEHDLEDTAAEVEAFRRKHQQLVQHWKKYLKEAATRGQRVVLWGGGSKAVAFLTTLGSPDEVDVVVDINPHKRNKYIPGTGHRVVGPDDLRELRPDIVVLLNPIYVSEVQRSLHERNLAPSVVPATSIGIN